MSSSDFVLEEVDRFCIKEEEHLNFENDANRRKSTQKYIEFEEDSTKCGEVMIARKSGFTLVCSLCMEHFSDLRTFGTHIQDLHIKTESGSELQKELVQNSLRTKVKSAKLESLDIKIISFESSDDDYQTSNASGNRSSQLDSPADTLDERDQDCEQSAPTKDLTNDSPTEIGTPTDSQEMIMKAPVNTIQRTCKYCDQQFVGFSTFKDHVLSHKGPNRYVCPHCPKTFISAAVRKSHVNTHTGERPHKCPHCPKGFADQGNLEMHIRTHLEIRKYACSYCDKRFVQSGVRKIHERTHTGEKPYQCEECGKRFIAQMKLTIHTRIHKNIKNFKCEVCGKAFICAKRLKEHMPAHSSERPFHCSVCGQNFPRRKSLRAHEQLHSNVKKYVCDICGKAFAQCAGLYSHKKSHADKAL